MILNSIYEVHPIEVITIAGREKGIIFLGKTFVLDKLYQTLDDAIAASRRDLDLGIAILIVPDAGKFGVWVTIPHQLICCQAA